MNRGDPKKMKKPQVERLRRIARDTNAEKPEMRKWARDQLEQAGHDEGIKCTKLEWKEHLPLLAALNIHTPSSERRRRAA